MVVSVWCKVPMTFLFVAKLFHLVCWNCHNKIMQAFRTGRNLLYIIVWYLMREFKYSLFAMRDWCFLVISQTITPNIFYEAYSSGKNWNGIGMGNAKNSYKNTFGVTKFAGYTFEQIEQLLKGNQLFWPTKVVDV